MVRRIREIIGIGSMRLAAASVLYFAIVFGAGFLLGPIRVIWLEPQLGKSIAVPGQAPFLLAVIISAARRVPARTGLAGDYGSLAAIGICALILQQFADFAVGTLLRGFTASEQLQSRRRPARFTPVCSCCSQRRRGWSTADGNEAPRDDIA